MTKTLYIAGPMTGIKDWNYPAFNAAESLLKSVGYEVLNPARQPDGLTYEEYLKRAMADVFACDGVALLTGYENSPGAKAELALADALGVDASDLSVWLMLGAIQRGKIAAN